MMVIMLKGSGGNNKTNFNEKADCLQKVIYDIEEDSVEQDTEAKRIQGQTG